MPLPRSIIERRPIRVFHDPRERTGPGIIGLMGAEAHAVLDVAGLEALLRALAAQDYRVLGPTVRDGAIVHDDIASVADLPRGLRDEQAGGHYRLVPRGDRACFGYSVGPQGAKRFLHVPQQTLWRTRGTGETLRIVAEPPGGRRIAFIGLRGCDLRAIAIQDRVLAGGEHADPHYRARRERVFVVAVHCGQAAATCFCTSMGSGPRAGGGYDLALTELVDGEQSTFVVEVGSAAGAELLAQLPQRAASAADVAAAERAVESTACAMQRSLRTDDVHDLLLRQPEHPRWSEVADRCLACGNCTMVCPTCFCTTVSDENALDGSSFTRSRHWDSCFSADFSYLHGGSVRRSTRARYRQWLTHKLASWIDQFGSSGCVGCGRCISWCPVGIDLTEEVAALRDRVQSGESRPT
jgi:ferredoxin